MPGPSKSSLASKIRSAIDEVINEATNGIYADAYKPALNGSHLKQKISDALNDFVNYKEENKNFSIQDK